MKIFFASSPSSYRLLNNLSTDTDFAYNCDSQRWQSAWLGARASLLDVVFVEYVDDVCCFDRLLKIVHNIDLLEVADVPWVEVAGQHDNMLFLDFSCLKGLVDFFCCCQSRHDGHLHVHKYQIELLALLNDLIHGQFSVCQLYDFRLNPLAYEQGQRLKRKDIVINDQYPFFRFLAGEGAGVAQAIGRKRQVRGFSPQIVILHEKPIRKTLQVPNLKVVLLLADRFEVCLPFLKLALDVIVNVELERGAALLLRLHANSARTQLFGQFLADAQSEPDALLVGPLQVID